MKGAPPYVGSSFLASLSEVGGTKWSALSHRVPLIYQLSIIVKRIIIESGFVVYLRAEKDANAMS
jgi:hypothetical protein